jgi:hypothetical protein
VVAAKDEMFDLIFFAFWIFQLVTENSSNADAHVLLESAKLTVQKPLCRAEMVGVAIFIQTGTPQLIL